MDVYRWMFKLYERSIGQLAMPNFFSAKYMLAMVPTNRAVQNKKQNKENLYIYTLKQDLPLPDSLIY